MREADAFESTAFLGLARGAKRDPYRLALFGQHLEPDERPLILLPVRGGTLLVTDRRVLELRAHLEVHGAWNVKEFQGYAVERAIDRTAVRQMAHIVERTSDAQGNRRIEDRLLVTTEDASATIVVSQGPEPTLPEDEFVALRTAVLGPQPK